MNDKEKFIRSLLIAATFLAGIWFVFGLKYLTGSELVFLGIWPRSLEGLHGILTGPFIHSNLNHIYNNSTALFPLTFALFFFYPKIGWRGLIYIYLITGFWVWVIARPSWHVGASGVVYGLAAFMFFSGIFRRDPRVIAVSLVVVMLYGSMVWGIFPVEDGVSWESHLLGGIAGGIVAWFFRKEDVLPRKKYFWEDEPEQDPRDERAVWNFEKIIPPPPVDYRNFEDRHYHSTEEE